MFVNKIAVWLVGVVVGVALAAEPNLAPPEPNGVRNNSVSVEAIYSPIFSFSGPIKRCESEGDPKAVGDSGKAMTQWQFHAGTFYGYGQKYGLLPKDMERDEVMNLLLNPEPYVAELAERIAMTMITQEGKAGLMHWSCYRIEKL